VATRDVLSADELAQLRGFPEIGRAELIRFFMLTPGDEEFVRRFRDKRNVLGAAVQLCTLPWLGFVPDDVPAAPAAAVARLSERLGIPVGELRGYGAREQTHSDHLGDVAAYLGWHQVDEPRWKDLEEFLFSRAMEHDSPKLLFRPRTPKATAKGNVAIGRCAGLVKYSCAGSAEEVGVPGADGPPGCHATARRSRQVRSSR
jgi:hypothetical protein